MKFIKMVSVCALTLTLATGCSVFGAVVGALPTVVQIVQDAMLILDQIDATAKPFFERAENQDLLDEYNLRMFQAKKTLNVALRATEGGKKLSDEEIDEAFEKFREAYKELLALLRGNNLMTAEGALKVGDGPSIEVDMPLAVSRTEK